MADSPNDRVVVFDKNGIKPNDESNLQTIIVDLMDQAHDLYKKNSTCPKTGSLNGNYIVRLCANEFFFYSEFIEIKKFEEIQNAIFETARTLPPGIQLILGSFIVKDKRSFVNVTPHITCGENPVFNFILKKNESDFELDLTFEYNKWADTQEPRQERIYFNGMPLQIGCNINNKKIVFSYDNIIFCKTPDGTDFITAVDICRDHYCGHAHDKYNTLIKKEPDLAVRPVSHVVISCTIDLKKHYCISEPVLHVDPIKSPSDNGCKNNFKQHPEVMAFSCAISSTITKIGVAPQDIYAKVPDKNNNVGKVSQAANSLFNRYIYHDNAARKHGNYTVTVDIIKDRTDEFTAMYQDYQGDNLKYQILENLRVKIEHASSRENLTKLEDELRASSEFKVLSTGQGFFTRITGWKTSSVAVFEDMINQQSSFINK